MPNRSRGKYDVTFEVGDTYLPFTLAEPSVSVELGPGRADEQIRNADVPRIYDGFPLGMGFSRRIPGVEGGYDYCLPGYTRAPGAILMPPGKITEISLAGITWSSSQGVILDSALFDDDLYLLTNQREVLVMDSGETAPVVSLLGPVSTIAQGMTIFNNRLWVSFGTGGLYYKPAGGGAWVGPAAVTRYKLATVTWRPQGIPTQFILGISSGPGVRYCPITEDPTVDADWQSAIPIPTTEGIVHKIVTSPQHAYFLTPDGVWDMDEYGARVFNVAKWLGEEIDANNAYWGLHIGTGMYITHHQGLFFVPTQGEMQYRPINCSPGFGLPHEGPIGHYPHNGAMHNGWLYIALTDGADGYVVAGKPSEAAHGEASHVWHGAEAHFTDAYVTHMKPYTTAPLSSWPRMLMATARTPLSDEVKLYWMSLTKKGTPIREMLTGGNFEPAEAATMFLPADPWDRPSALKSLLQIDLNTELLSESDYFSVYATADEDDYLEQGLAVEGAYTSIAPAGTSDDAAIPTLIEGRYIKTKIEAIGSPILRSVELRAALGIELREARVYRVVLARDAGLRTVRGRDTRDPEALYAELRSILGQVVMVDDGIRFRARVLQVMSPSRTQLGTARAPGGWAIVCPVMISILDQPFIWGSSTWGAGGTWG
jgi:hypothetical protein